MSQSERISPERLALALLGLGLAAALFVGAAIPAGFLLQRSGLLGPPESASWNYPVAAPAAAAGQPVIPPSLRLSEPGMPRVVDLAFGREGELFVLRSNGTIEHFDVESGILQRTGFCLVTAQHIGYARGADRIVAVSPQRVEFFDGRTLEKSREDCVLDGAASMSLYSEAEVVVDPSARWLATGSPYDSVAVWNTDSGSRVDIGTGSVDSRLAALFLPGDRLVVSCSTFAQGGVQSTAEVVVELESGTTSRWPRGYGSMPALAMAPAEDGSGLVNLITPLGSVLFDPATGRSTPTGNVPASSFGPVYSPDCRLVHDTTGTLIDVPTGARAGFLPPPATNCAVEFSPDGRWLARGWPTGEIEIFDISALAVPPPPAETPAP